MFAMLPQTINYAPHDVYTLYKEFGGVFGTLESGNDMLANVLQIDKEIYVTTEEVNKKWDVLAAVAGAKVFSVNKGAELLDLTQRLRSAGYGKTQRI